MTAIAETTAITTSRTDDWDRLLLWSVATVIAADVTVQILAQTVIPPLAGVTVVSLLALGLFRVKRRAGIALLGAVALIWGLGSLGFSADHLQHPESGIDFVHAVTEIVGRLTIVVAAIAAWRGAATTWTRRVAVTAGVVIAGGIVIGAASSLASASDQAQAGDVATTVEHAEFSDMAVASGESLYVENADLFRHTFTVEGTAVDVDLPSKRGVRVPIDLPAGTYTVVCEVPGHEFMEGTLTVR